MIDNEIELYIVKLVKDEIQEHLNSFLKDRNHSCPQNQRILTLEMGNNGIIIEINKVHVAIKDTNLSILAMLENYRKEQKESIQNLHNRVNAIENEYLKNVITKRDLLIFISILSVILTFIYFLMPRLNF